ncbi:hypothetical protein AYO22_03220 [Fonsecaea multimorphosa]|nr:hypothetical protein AYO22_03220 [Fonsecaea multimorphosa]
MRGFGERQLSAHGHCLRSKIAPQISCLRVSISPVKHRAVSTSHGRHLLERTIPNPATSQYDEKPIYPSIPLKGRVPSTLISTCDLTSTTPAKLDTPQPLNQQDYNGPIPISDRVRWYFRLGKSYLAFYKTGFKNIWHNYNELRKIRGRFGSRKLEDVVKYGGSGSAGNADVEPALIITRDEYQMALRTRHDLGKLVPFSIVFAVCGEFTPLVILAIGSAAVPYTCRIPKQEQHDFLRPVRIQAKYTAQVDKLLGEDPMTRDANHIHWKLEFIEAYRLHVNPFLRPIPGLGFLWHKFYSGPRLRKHCEEVLCDTILIRREGGFRRLSPREVFQWSLKYGLRSLTDYMDNQRRQGVSVDPESPELKETLLPIVEAEADYILGVDWRRLNPENHWLSVFRPIPVTPDDRHLSER